MRGILTCFLRGNFLFAPLLAYLAMPAPAAAQGYNTNFDDAPTGWQLAPPIDGVGWAMDGTPASFPSGVSRSGLSLNYNNGAAYPGTNSGNATSPQIALSGLTNPSLSFWDNFNTETRGIEWDRRRVQILSATGQTVLADFQMASVGYSFSASGGLTGIGPGPCAEAYVDLESGVQVTAWHMHKVYLDPSWGTIRVRFVFDTVDEQRNGYGGWAIDDLAVTSGSVGPPTGWPDVSPDTTSADGDGNELDDSARVGSVIQFAWGTSNTGTPGVHLIVGQHANAQLDQSYLYFDSIHGHHHFSQYADFAVWQMEPSGFTKVRRGPKRSYCLLDVNQVIAGTPSTSPGCGSSYQQISYGWQDVYALGTSGQEVNIAGLATNSDYWLVGIVDPLNRFRELDNGNQTDQIHFLLPTSGGQVPILDRDNPYPPTTFGLSITSVTSSSFQGRPALHVLGTGFDTSLVPVAYALENNAVEEAPFFTIVSSGEIWVYLPAPFGTPASLDLIKASGEVASARVLDCEGGGACEDFTLSLSPTSLTVAPGGAATNTVVIGSQGSFSSAVDLSVSGLPGGVTATFLPNPGTPPANGTLNASLTVTASASANLGTFSLTVTGTSGARTHTTLLTLTVAPAPQPDFDLLVSPGAVTVIQGGSVNATTAVSSLAGFGSAVALSASGLPSGVTASFSPTPVTPPANGSTNSTLTLTASIDPNLGAHELSYVVFGTGGTSPITTDPMTTQASGSTMLVGLARAVATTSAPTDNKGNTYTQVGTTHAYNDWPTWGTSIWADVLISGGSGHTVSAAFPFDDEVTMFALEVKNGGLVKDHAYSETTGSPATSGTVTTDGPAQLIAFWWGTAGTGPHTATPSSGWTIQDSVLVAGNLIQGAVATRYVQASGSYSVTWTHDNPGAQLWLVAIQQAGPPAAATGTFSLLVTGTSGSLTHTTPLTLTITAPPEPDFGISVSPGSVTVIQGGSVNATTAVSSLAGFGSAVALSASGLPSGITASFSPTPVTPPANGSTNSTLTLTASATAATGTFPVTVSGTSGSTAHSVTLSLTVSPPSGAGDVVAAYDSTLRAPRCIALGKSCDSGTLLTGRRTLGPEVNQPNTINASCADGTSGTFHFDESNDRIKVLTTDGSVLAAGKTVRVEATVFADNHGSFSSDRLDLYRTANANSPAWTLIATLTPSVGGSQVLSGTYTLPSGALQAVRARFRFEGSASPCGTGSFDDHDDLVFAVSAGVPDFSVSSSPASVSLVQGNSGTSTVAIGSQNGFTGAVDLSVSGVPSGATASFLPNPATPPASGSVNVALTLTASSTAATGTFSVLVIGTSGSLTHTTPLTLAITAPPAPDFGIAVSPSLVTVTPGGSGTTTTTVTSLNGFNSATTVTTAGLPSGVTASLSANPVTPPANGSVAPTLTLSASPAAVTGSFTVTVTGTSGALTHSTTLILTVPAVPQPDFSVSVSPGSVGLTQGGSGNTTTTVASLNGFGSAVDLSVSGLPSGVTASFLTTPVTPPANGSVTAALAFTASATATTGIFPVMVTGTSGSVTHNATVTLTVSPPGPVTVFYDGAESATTSLTLTNTTRSTRWTRGNSLPYAGSYRWKVGNATGGNYGNNGDARLTTPTLSLAGAASATLTYAFKQKSEVNDDFFEVRISTNGGTNWTNLVRVSGQSAGYSAWAPLASINLNAYVGQTNVRIQFRFTTDASVTDFGVAVDEIKVVKQ